MKNSRNGRQTAAQESRGFVLVMGIIAGALGYGLTIVITGSDTSALDFMIALVSAVSVSIVVELTMCVMEAIREGQHEVAQATAAGYARLAAAIKEDRGQSAEDVIGALDELRAAIKVGASAVATEIKLKKMS
jgi:hypothetical protein